MASFVRLMILALKNQYKAKGERMKKNELSRRRLLRSIAAGAGVAATTLPKTWVTPVVDSVMLPAHAQTSPTTCSPTTFTSTQTSGPLCPAVTSNPAPNPAPFVFNWPGLTPNGNGTLTVTANGDITGNEGPNQEAWRIEFDGNFVGDVGNTNPAVGGFDTATEVFAISLQDLLNAGGSATVTASNVLPNGGVIDCDPGIQNDVSVTLTFPACTA